MNGLRTEGDLVGDLLGVWEVEEGVAFGELQCGLKSALV